MPNSLTRRGILRGKASSFFDSLEIYEGTLFVFFSFSAPVLTHYSLRLVTLLKGNCLVMCFLIDINDEVGLALARSGEKTPDSNTVVIML